MTSLQKRLGVLVIFLFILTSLGLPMLTRAASRPAETRPVQAEVILEDPTAYHHGWHSVTT